MAATRCCLQRCKNMLKRCQISYILPSRFEMKWSTCLFRFRTPSGSTITFFYLKVESFYFRKFNLLSERKNRVHVRTVYLNMIIYSAYLEEIYRATLRRQQTYYEITRYPVRSTYPVINPTLPHSKLKHSYILNFRKLKTVKSKIKITNP